MRNIFILIFILISSVGFAQSEILAKNYFDQGEFEKAISLYEKAYAQNKGRQDIALAIVEGNQQLERYDEAERWINILLENVRYNPQFLVELGYNFALQNKEVEAQTNYAKAKSFVAENANYAYVIGTTFEKYSLLDDAVEVYESAMASDENKDFNAQVARIYGEQGKLEKMFESYINLIEKNVSFRPAAQRNFSLYVTEDPINEANEMLRKALLKRSQNNPDIVYNELLSWLFIQQKEYKKAFIQEKAIFKRTDDDLSRISDLALIAISENAYADATEIVTFLIENSFTSESKIQGNQYLMKIALQTATSKEYPKMEKRFQDLISEYGNGPQTYSLQIDYNHFLAFNAEKLEAAIENLKSLSSEKLTKYQEARVKMELADILVFDEKFNEALLYYSQIQNMVASDVLAQDARFKVAQTSYFKGDFEWAQVQLDVLRKSTSQLIANDAMQLSLLIRDNTLEDSLQVALKKYARADLLAFQNKNKEAIAALDDILTNNKGESIEDEALLKQGEFYEKTGDFAKAEADYKKVIEFFNEDILADDAHYKLANLYETKLSQPEKAKELYEQIIFNFSDSIYYVEARRKFRALRGDAIN